MKTRRSKATFWVASLATFAGLYHLLLELHARAEILVLAIVLSSTAIMLVICAFWEMPEKAPWWVRARREPTQRQ